MRVRLVALIVLLAAAGCRTVPVSAPIDWPTEKRERQELSAWEMGGRAAVATATDGWSAGIRWQQDGEASELNLSGALGVGGVRVRSEGEKFTIDTSRGEHVEAGDATTALAQTIGVELPVRNLRFWLLGVPAPGSAAVEVPGSDGLPKQLEQEGWTMTYDRYSARDGRMLPGRVVLRREPVRVRLVIDRWDLHP